MKIEINRQLAGVEDIAWGTEQVEQERGGKKVLITQINAGNMPFDESMSLKEALETRYPAIVAIGENIEKVSAIGDNIVEVTLVGENIDALKTVAREIVAVVNNHLQMDDITKLSQHSGHLEVIGNDLSLHGTSFIADLGSITEPVETSQKGRSDIVTVSENIDKINSLVEHTEELQLVADRITNVNLVGEDLSMSGLGHTLDGGLITDPVSQEDIGISTIETVAENIESVVIDAENIDSIIKVAENIESVGNIGENITAVEKVGNDLSLNILTLMMDCGEVTDNVIELPQTQSHIITVSDNMEDITNVAEHLTGIVAVYEDMAHSKLGHRIDGGLITDPIDFDDNPISYIETVALNMADISTVAMNIDTIIEVYDAATAAIAAESKAKDWAEKEFNSPVEPGMYSAKHYAILASNIVGAGVIDDTASSSATTYSSSKIDEKLEDITDTAIQIESPSEGALAMYTASGWQAVTELDLGNL